MPLFCDECDPRKLYTNLGDVKGNSKYVPFQISYATEAIENYTLYDEPTVPCYKTVNVNLQLFLVDSVGSKLKFKEKFIYRTQRKNVRVLTVNICAENHHHRPHHLQFRSKYWTSMATYSVLLLFLYSDNFIFNWSLFTIFK